MATKSRHLKTAIQLWVADERKAGGYTSKDLAEWTGVSMDTARGWESRGRPSEDAISILERKFGKPAPRGGDATADQSDLVTAIRNQTVAIDKLISRFDALATEAIRAGVRDALLEAGVNPNGGGSPASPPDTRSP